MTVGTPGAYRNRRGDIFGEGEFYLAIGKVSLAFLLAFYTFFVVCGANPDLEVSVLALSAAAASYLLIFHSQSVSATGTALVFG